MYEKYIEIQNQIDVLESQKDSIRKKIEETLPTEGFKNEKINAFWTTKKKWTYSPKVKGLEAEIKATKEKEEEEGLAKFEEVKQLTIKIK